MSAIIGNSMPGSLEIKIIQVTTQARFGQDIVYDILLMNKNGSDAKNVFMVVTIPEEAKLIELKLSDNLQDIKRNKTILMMNDRESLKTSNKVMLKTDNQDKKLATTALIPEPEDIQIMGNQVTIPSLQSALLLKLIIKIENPKNSMPGPGVLNVKNIVSAEADNVVQISNSVSTLVLADMSVSKSVTTSASTPSLTDPNDIDPTNKNTPTVIFSGSKFQYNINVKNNTSSTFTDVEIIDTLPMGIKFISSTPTATSVVFPTSTEAGYITFNSIVFKPLQTHNFTISAVLNSDVQAGNILTSTAICDNRNSYLSESSQSNQSSYSQSNQSSYSQSSYSQSNHESVSTIISTSASIMSLTSSRLVLSINGSNIFYRNKKSQTRANTKSQTSANKKSQTSANESKPINYTIVLHNNGPSDASNVIINESIIGIYSNVVSKSNGVVFNQISGEEFLIDLIEKTNNNKTVNVQDDLLDNEKYNSIRRNINKVCNNNNNRINYQALVSNFPAGSTAIFQTIINLQDISDYITNIVSVKSTSAMNSDSTTSAYASTRILNGLTSAELNGLTNSRLNDLTNGGLNDLTNGGLNGLTNSGLNNITNRELNDIKDDINIKSMSVPCDNPNNNQSNNQSNISKSNAKQKHYIKKIMKKLEQSSDENSEITKIMNKYNELKKSDDNRSVISDKEFINNITKNHDDNKPNDMRNLSNHIGNNLVNHNEDNAKDNIIRDKLSKCKKIKLNKSDKSKNKSNKNNCDKHQISRSCPSSSKNKSDISKKDRLNTSNKDKSNASKGKYKNNKKEDDKIKKYKNRNCSKTRSKK